MKTLHWVAIVGMVLGAGLVACSSSDTTSSTGGSGGVATGGTGGSATGGTAGATGGSAGSATGGSAGSATGGSAGSATGGSAGSGTGGSAGSTLPMDSPCVQACVGDNPEAWKLLVDAVAPCICADGVCKTECTATYCATPVDYTTQADCGNCALTKGQGQCMGQLAACLGNAACEPVATCLLGCQ